MSGAELTAARSAYDEATLLSESESSRRDQVPRLGDPSAMAIRLFRS